MGAAPPTNGAPFMVVLRADPAMIGQATVVGVMTQSNEQSIEEAEVRLTAESGSGTHLFKALRSPTADGRTSAGIPTLRVQHDLTDRDVTRMPMYKLASL